MLERAICSDAPEVYVRAHMGKNCLVEQSALGSSNSAHHTVFVAKPRRFPEIGRLRQKVDTFKRSIKATMERLMASGEFAGMLAVSLDHLQSDLFCIHVSIGNVLGACVTFQHLACPSIASIFLDPPVLSTNNNLVLVVHTSPSRRFVLVSSCSCSCYCCSRSR